MRNSNKLLLGRIKPLVSAYNWIGPSSNDTTAVQEMNLDRNIQIA
jgi:hypothetical protein